MARPPDHGPSKKLKAEYQMRNLKLRAPTGCSGTLSGTWMQILPGVIGNGAITNKADTTVTVLSRFYRIQADVSGRTEYRCGVP